MADNQAIIKRLILQERARRVAKRKFLAEDVGDSIEVVEFLLNGERYAFDIMYLMEVCFLTHITYIPCSPSFVIGVTNIRGQIIPIVDIKSFLELPDRQAENGRADKDQTLWNQAMIMEKDKIVVGFLAEDVLGAEQIYAKSLQKWLATTGGVIAECIKGITTDQVIVLDSYKVLTNPKLLGRSTANSQTDTKESRQLEI